MGLFGPGHVVVLIAATTGILIWTVLVILWIRRSKRLTTEQRELQIGFRLSAASWSESHVEGLLDANPNSPTLLAAYVRLVIDRQDWPEAGRRAAMFTERAPRSAAAMELQLWTLRELHDDAAAAKLLRRAVRRAPKAFWLQLAWAEDPQRRQDLEESVRRFAWLRTHFPEEERAYQDGARLLARMPGRKPEAQAIIAEGLRRLPGSWQMLQVAAEFAEQDGDYAAALGLWNDMRERFPGEVTGYVRGAQAMAKLDLSNEAAALIDQARGFFPGNKEAIRVAAELGSPESASGN